MNFIALIVPSWVATCPLTLVEPAARLTNMPTHRLLVILRDGTPCDLGTFPPDFPDMPPCASFSS